MAAEITTIPVPHILKAGVQDVEAFYALVEAVPPANHYVFDMRAVDFVKPYGVIALATAARRLSALSGRPVRLENLNDQVHLYLHRMDLFDVGSDWLQPAGVLDEERTRNPQTPNLLELTPIAGPEDVAAQSPEPGTSSPAD